MCKASERCAFFGECSFVPTPAGAPRPVFRPECFPGPGDCAPSEVCKQLGWCEPIPHTYRGAPPGPCQRASCLTCGATQCEDTELCRRWGACTLVDNRCYVRASATAEPACAVHPVTGVRASASSTHAPDKFGTYDARFAADRDARTTWTPAPGTGPGVTLNFHLPKPARVARVWIRGWFSRADARGDLAYLYGRILQGVVRVGPVVEMYYHLRTNLEKREGYSVTVPPTLTSDVSFEIGPVMPSFLYPEPAITEVLIEACDP